MNKKKLHIALVFDGFDQGGIGKVNLTLAKWLLDNGHFVDLIVFSTDGPRRAQVPNSARIINLSRASKLALFFKFFNYFMKNSPDGIYVANAKTSIYVAVARFLSRKSSRVIGIHHTNMNTDFVSNKLGTLYRLSVKYLARFANKFCDLHLAAVSEGARLGLSKCMGIDQHKIFVLYNPVTLAGDPGVISENIRIWWDEGVCKLLAVGRLTPEKGYTTLLKAIKLLKDSHNPRLIIVGSGPYDVEIKRIISDEEIEDNVFLAGFQPNPELFYKNADIFVLSSLSEAFPLTIVEALSAGNQVVSTDCDYGPREILENGKWGRLVPVNDVRGLCLAIKEIIASPIPSACLKLRANEFSAEKCISNYLKLLNS